VAAGKKAVHAMRRRCISLHLSDPATICKLFDILVLPILSYTCEVWAVNPKVGAKAELVHRQFLKQLLGVRKSTTNHLQNLDVSLYRFTFGSRFCVTTTEFVLYQTAGLTN